jgi:type VI secretion system secreted protein Hcp
VQTSQLKEDSMASDMFLEIEGIKGESADDKHKDQIELMSWSWGLSQTSSMASGTGGGAGKVNFQDFHVQKLYDKASPNLLMACAEGKHIKSIKLHQCKAGGKKEEFLTITFSDCFISNLQPGASGEVVTEAMSFAFAKCKVEYKPQKADGSLDAAVTGGWDVKANKKEA